MAKRGRPKKVVIPFEDQQPEVPLEYAALINKISIIISS